MFEFVVVGADKARRDTMAIARRLLHLEEPLHASFRIMEEAEAAVFAGLGGKYVKTGTVRSSLTSSSADGAVRETIDEGVKFGTEIWYAHFLTERVGPKTPKGGMKRPPPSAVLKITPMVRERVLRELDRYVMHGTRI